MNAAVSYSGTVWCLLFRALSRLTHLALGVVRESILPSPVGLADKIQDAQLNLNFK